MATYALSDLHDNVNLWHQIKNYLKDEDTLIYLGDAIDRGSGDIEIMLDLLNRPNTVYLCGNHEIMLLDALNKRFSELDFWDKNLLQSNDTWRTYLYCRENMSVPDRIELREKIRALPHFYKYINKDNKEIFLSHAGCNPRTIVENTYTLKDLVWDRRHLNFRDWDEEKYPNLYIIHGHTPTITITNDEENVTIYKSNKGHKIDIDLGCFYTHKTVLFNLDTFEETYFEEVKVDDVR